MFIHTKTLFIFLSLPYVNSEIETVLPLVQRHVDSEKMSEAHPLATFGKPDKTNESGINFYDENFTPSTTTKESLKALAVSNFYLQRSERIFAKEEPKLKGETRSLLEGRGEGSELLAPLKNAPNYRFKSRRIAEHLVDPSTSSFGCGAVSRRNEISHSAVSRQKINLLFPKGVEQIVGVSFSEDLFFHDNYIGRNMGIYSKYPKAVVGHKVFTSRSSCNESVQFVVDLKLEDVRPILQAFNSFDLFVNGEQLQFPICKRWNSILQSVRLKDNWCFTVEHITMLLGVLSVSAMSPLIFYSYQSFGEPQTDVYVARVLVRIQTQRNKFLCACVQRRIWWWNPYCRWRVL